jgi:hypothetical protein
MRDELHRLQLHPGYQLLRLEKADRWFSKSHWPLAKTRRRLTWRIGSSPQAIGGSAKPIGLSPKSIGGSP